MNGFELLAFTPAILFLAGAWIIAERIARSGKAHRTNASTMGTTVPPEIAALKAAKATADAMRRASRMAEAPKGTGDQPSRSLAPQQTRQVEEPKSAG